MSEKKSIFEPGRALVVAEIGINHNGDMGLAREQIRAAKAAGADAVKFQNYRTEDFLADRSLTYSYRSGGRVITEPQWDMFKRCELAPGELAQLKAWCDEEAVLFGSTPTHAEGVRELVRLGAAFVKNGSDFLGHLPLIREMARSGLPTILSTGMATPDEIEEARRAFIEAGGKELVLLVCTSAYPTAPEDAHLARIPEMRKRFELPTGFSDHTRGWLAAAVAAGLGAVFIEKHFTTSRSLPGPDHEFSAEPEEFARLVEAVREVEKLLGSAAIGPAASELAARESYRLGAVAARNLEAGEVFSIEDVVFRRPACGLTPAQVERRAGARLSRALRQGEAVREGDFET